MRHILIIRFGALGDLCLLAWSIWRWVRSNDAANQQVTLVTKAAFAPLMQKMHGIDRVIPLPEGGIAQLHRLARQLRAEKFDTIIDGHNILRGNLLLMLMGRRPHSRLQKDTAARLALLGFHKSHQSLNQTMNDRFDALFTAQTAQGLGEGSPPLAHLRPNPSVGKTILGLAPGAQWDSKRWPEEYYSELMQNYCRNTQNPVRIFLGPREESWFAGSRLQQVAGELSQVEIIRGKSLIQVAELVAHCSVVVTNDSGLLHISEAAGTPVLAFYGPTVRQFGYFPQLPESRVMEVAMDCRPCSRNGKKACHRGDLACLRDINPEQALQTLAQIMKNLESAT